MTETSVAEDCMQLTVLSPRYRLMSLASATFNKAITMLAPFPGYWKITPNNNIQTRMARNGLAA